MSFKAARMTEHLKKSFPDQNLQVFEAISTTQRDLFVGAGWRRMAYDDRSLPIGLGQTISKPSTVLKMLSSMESAFGGRLLEVGSGSGYLAAVASKLFSRVFCIERILPLIETSRANLRTLGANNVQVRYGDGSAGWLENAPFDAILYSAGAPELPPSLFEQLGNDGLAGVPIGTKTSQNFVVFKRENNELNQIFSFPCSFVPLIGKEGWNG